MLREQIYPETNISYIEGEEWIHYCTNVRRNVTRMNKLMKEQPENIVFVREGIDGMMFYKVNPSWMKQPAPKKRVSEEKAEAARQRMIAWHQENDVKSEDEDEEDEPSITNYMK